MAKRILIVDDEKHIRELLSDILKMHGYKNIMLAEDGVDALKKSKKRKFDLIILDVNLPKLDGYEVLKYLMRNKKTKNVPIIVLSCEETIGTINKFMDLGAKDYMLKKYSSTKLIEKIKEYI